MANDGATPRDIQMIGGGNVAGDDNIVVITKQYFIGEYEHLGKAYIDPQEVFDRVKLDYFVGREWLLNIVDGFLRKYDRGYFILEAEAGLGKTTFLAWLVKKRGYISHFVELKPGTEGIEAGLRNLAAQLASTCRSNAYEGDWVFAGTADWSNRVYNLLKRAADQRRDGEKIVLVVDALDEAGAPHGQNALALPKVLPKGVYFIVSQRPTAVPLQVDCPRQVFHLDANRPENLDDMTAYLTKAAVRLCLLGVLDLHLSGQFAEALLRKSQGLWIYAHHVVKAIEDGDRSPLDLEALPTGLWQYYARYWLTWQQRDEDAWYGKYLPLLATLAAARDALSLKQLCSLAGVEESPDLSDLLQVKWALFVQTSDVEGSCRYRPYHASLREFLSGQAVDSDALSQSERGFSKGLADAVHRAHVRIVDRYLEAWGGIEAGLPKLTDPAIRDLDERYGVYHLTAHLETAGRVEDLHRLLKVETGDHRNTWYIVKDAIGDIAGYMGDVERAWSLAEREYDLDKVEPTGKNIGLQYRYALITASLSGLAETIPSSLLIALVKWGVWSPEQGLAYASRIPDSTSRVETLAALLACLPESLQENAIDVAFAAVQEVQHEYGAYPDVVARSLADLAPFMSGPSRERVLRHFSAMVDTPWVDVRMSEPLADLVTGLAPYLEMPLLGEALTIVRKLPIQYHKADALAKLAPVLPETLLHEALAIARELERNSRDWNPRAMALWSPRATALMRLAPHLPTSLGEEALQEALEVLEELPLRLFLSRHSPRIEQSLELAPYLPQAWRERLQAFVGTRIQPSVTDCGNFTRYFRDEGLMYLVTRLAQAGHLEMALKALRWIEQGHGRYYQAVSELACYLPEPHRSEILHRALAVCRKATKLSALDYPVDTLKELAPFLPRSLRGKVYWVRGKIAWHAPHRPKLRNGRWHKVRNRLRGSVPDVLLRWIISLKRALETKRGWAVTLGRLAPYMSESLLWETLAMVQHVEDSRLELAELAPRLAESGRFQEALEAARAVHGWYRAKAFAGLMHYLPEELKSQALQETLEAIESLWGWEEPQKVDLLVSLLSCAPGQFDLDALYQILSVVMGIKWPNNCAPILRRLALHLIDVVDKSTLVRFWTKEYEDIGFLHVLSRRQRSHLLSYIGALAPLIAALGGTEAAAEAFQAFQDVERWWR